jgi:hypothetical protein
MYLIAWKNRLGVHVQPLYWVVGGLSHRLQMRKQLLGVLVQTLHRIGDLSQVEELRKIDL